MYSYGPEGQKGTANGGLLLGSALFQGVLWRKVVEMFPAKSQQTRVDWPPAAAQCGFG